MAIDCSQGHTVKAPTSLYLNDVLFLFSENPKFLFYYRLEIRIESLVFYLRRVKITN